MCQRLRVESGKHQSRLPSVGKECDWGRAVRMYRIHPGSLPTAPLLQWGFLAILIVIGRKMGCFTRSRSSQDRLVGQDIEIYMILFVHEQRFHRKERREIR